MSPSYSSKGALRLRGSLLSITTKIIQLSSASTCQQGRTFQVRGRRGSIGPSQASLHRLLPPPSAWLHSSAFQQKQPHKPLHSHIHSLQAVTCAPPQRHICRLKTRQSLHYKCPRFRFSLMWPYIQTDLWANSTPIISQGAC